MLVWRLFLFSGKVARYKPQGFFKLHTDHVEAFNSLVCGGRLGTLIIYLNDDFTGGQTDFPFVEASVEPCTGDAIYFHSVVVSSAPHAHALCLRSACMQGGTGWLALSSGIFVFLRVGRVLSCAYSL